MQACQERRFRVLFNEDETQKLSKTVKKISNQLKQELKHVEKNIRLYINEELLEAENDLMWQIKDNMSQNILTELNSFSKKFKLNQELYSQKCKELVIEEEDNSIALEMYDLSTNNSDFNENNYNNGDNNFLMKEEPDQLLDKRENEINDIIRGVSNLQELFKDLHVIVIEQGSILDRIDYNIEASAINVSKGKQHLINAHEMQKNSCFKRAILALIFILFVESVLLIMKIL